MTLSLFGLVRCLFFGDGHDGRNWLRLGCKDLSFGTVFFSTHTSARTVCHSSPAVGPRSCFFVVFLHGSSCNHHLQTVSPGEKGREANSENRLRRGYVVYSRHTIGLFYI